MKREDYLMFLDEDPEFITQQYNLFIKEEKYSLWLYRLTFDFRDDSPGHDPLEKFNKKNYLKWQQQEVDFDEILDKIIQEALPAWNLWYKDWEKRTLAEEIYHRIGKVS